MDKEIKELEDAIFDMRNQVRSEMENHFWRTVRLEQKFQELMDKFLEIKMGMKTTDNKGEKQ